jgi:hypothetical protein
MHHLGGCLAARADLVHPQVSISQVSLLQAGVEQKLKEYLSLSQSRIEHGSMNFTSKLRIIA